MLAEAAVLAAAGSAAAAQDAAPGEACTAPADLPRGGGHASSARVVEASPDGPFGALPP